MRVSATSRSQQVRRSSPASTSFSRCSWAISSVSTSVGSESSGFSDRSSSVLFISSTTARRLSKASEACPQGSSFASRLSQVNISDRKNRV